MPIMQNTVKCGNRLCKNHDNSDIYTNCYKSPYSGKRGQTIWCNMCPNELLTGKEKNVTIPLPETDTL